MSARTANDHARARHCDPFLGILDHVDDVAEVHDLRRREFCIGPVRRIPTVRLDATETEVTDVVTATAAEVKEGRPGTDQAIRECNLDRTRIVRSRDRGLLTVLGKESREVHKGSGDLTSPCGIRRDAQLGRPQGANRLMPRAPRPLFIRTGRGHAGSARARQPDQVEWFEVAFSDSFLNTTGQPAPASRFASSTIRRGSPTSGSSWPRFATAITVRSEDRSLFKIPWFV